MFISEFDITEINISHVRLRNVMRKNVSRVPPYGYYGYGRDPEYHYSGKYRIADVDAQITTEEELVEQLRALDAIGTDEARRLQEILKIMWEWKQKRAQGRKIRRVADLKADIRKKVEQRPAEIRKIRDRTTEYIREYWNGKEWEQGIAGKRREIEKEATTIEKREERMPEADTEISRKKRERVLV